MRERFHHGDRAAGGLNVDGGEVALMSKSPVEGFEDFALHQYSQICGSYTEQLRHLPFVEARRETTHREKGCGFGTHTRCDQLLEWWSKIGWNPLAALNSRTGLQFESHNVSGAINDATLSNTLR